MTINLVLSDVKILDWAVNVELRNVVVHYYRLFDDGAEYDDGYATFWETIPNPGTDPNGDPLPIPDDWYQLPASHVTAIITLTQDARIALGSLVGEVLT
jgi:hypothetical protein